MDSFPFFSSPGKIEKNLPGELQYGTFNFSGLQFFFGIENFDFPVYDL